jgi:2,3-bisphosphoglycerate-dependent phosphoglycerate mutase
MEGMTGEQIVARELATGVPIVYRLNPDSTIASREELA